MGKISQGPAIRVTARLKGCRLNQNCSDEPTRNREDTHDKRCGEQQFFRVANPVPTDERHYGHPGLKSRQPQRQLGKYDHRHGKHEPEAAMLVPELLLPSGDYLGCFSTSTTATETTTRLSVK